MGVIEAKIQTVEEIYRLVWAAVANKQPMGAIYKERRRLFCPHRLGRNQAGQRRVLCYQYGGESESGGHIDFVERGEVIKEALAWLDRYLGPVKTQP